MATHDKPRRAFSLVEVLAAVSIIGVITFLGGFIPIVGAFVAGLIFPAIGFGLGGGLAAIVHATLGAVILLILIRVLKRA